MNEIYIVIPYTEAIIDNTSLVRVYDDSKEKYIIGLEVATAYKQYLEEMGLSVTLSAVVTHTEVDIQNLRREVALSKLSEEDKIILNITE